MIVRERERERNCTTSIQPAWLMTPDLCSCLGHLQPDGTKARAVKNVMKLIANSLSVAKVAPTEMAGEARPNKPALLNRQRM